MRNILTEKPQPFVKWAGGKRSLIDKINFYFPDRFNNYYEPFVGGGAVFFEFEKITHAYLSDINFDLIVTYQVIKKEPRSLINKLKEYSDKHSEEFYYSIRANEPRSSLDIAARFLYLNKTCYNGLYRVNKAGNFNVPMGNYKNPNIIQEDNILTCSEVLKKADILCHSFEKIRPEKNDLVYIDPPYHPTVEESFTKYTKENFTEEDQVKLSEFIKRMNKAGVLIMLSNSKTKFIEHLYPKKYFNHHVVYAPRFVNCKPDKRGEVEELIITNY